MREADAVSVCAICGFALPEHDPDCPALNAPKLDHDDYLGNRETEEPTADDVRGILKPDTAPMYAISEAALEGVENALRLAGFVQAEVALGYIRAVRENGPIGDEPDAKGSPEVDGYGLDEKAERDAMVESLMEEDRIQTERLQEQANKIAFLSAQVSNLVQRQAGELLARGLMGLDQARAWAQDELAKVNASLAAIEVANQGDGK